MPKLFRVILPVTDIEKARTFYGLVLGTPGERVSPGRHYFDCGGTLLACYDPVADFVQSSFSLSPARTAGSKVRQPASGMARLDPGEPTAR